MSAPMSTRVSTKGQVILPKPIREHQNWGAGTRLLVEETEAGVLLRSAPLFAATTLADVAGRLSGSGTVLSVEEMDAVVAREAARRARD